MRSKALHILLILLLTVGMATTAKGQGHLKPTPDEEKNGITVGGNTYKPLSKIKIAGNVYGGGDKAAVKGNTNVTINTGEYGGSIFGGGNGELDTDGVTVIHSADIGTYYDGTDGEHEAGTLVENTGETNVTINGGEIVYYVGDKDNFRNIYGGGNAACNVAGNTHVTMNKGMMTAWSFVSSDYVVAAWQHFYDNHNANDKQPVCAVFGAGFGANTDVALDTHVDINLGETRTKEYTKTDLIAANNFITHDRPNPALSQKFVTGVFGGGYNGTVGAFDKDKYASDPTTLGINRDDDEHRDANDYLSNTHVNLTGSPYTFTIFGGGLGSKGAADRDEDAAKWGSRVGAVFGGTKVNVQGGFVFGSVFGGGAGIYGAVHITTPREGDMPYINAAQVFRETDVTINGAGTVVIGNVYGGGDIANTGWYTVGTRPTEAEHVEQTNMSLAKLDYTTSVHLLGGNVMGQVFGGANGRKKSEITLAHLIGAVIGSTNLEMGENIDQTDGKLHGTTVWNRIYGGCNVGQVYACAEIATNRGQAGLARAMAEGVTDGCTNLVVYNGKMAHDIFAGGFGDVNDSGTPDDKSDDVITSADISGNTYIYFKKGDLEWEHYWDAKTANFIEQSSAIGHWGDEQDVCHNLYGGGNIACVVKGNSHVYMSGAPAAPAGFTEQPYWNACIANVALPHFSVFGGGFGINAKINGNALSDINLERGSGFHSIIGGGMNGPVGGMCKVHVGNDPLSRVHHVYGGGYYAPCEKTELNITRGTIVSDVFGGSVMGNITPYKRDNDGNLIPDGEGNLQPDVNLYATKTTIGLQDEGAGRHSSIDLEDEYGTTLRSYTYAEHQNQITIGGNVYGANDVSGTVNGMASLTIYGGTIKGQVYGAGNGNHVGYYVPDELKYNMGAHGTANYYYVDHSAHNNGPKGNTYVGRPQTIGGVELTLEGNTTTERVKVLGQVFGGGNSCTIGDWNKAMLAPEGKYHGDPHLTRDDPDYFLGGGKLYVNIGSHVTIGRTHQQLAEDADGSTYIDNEENVSGLFMGCSGRNLATQNGDYEHDNYYHHFYNYNAGKYYPGFAVGTEAGEPMTREQQLKPFQAYLNNVMIWTDDVRLRINNHDGSAAEDVWLANFVGGGFRGSMRAKTVEGTFDYTIPEGVTVSHTIVGGAYNAHVRYHYFDTDNDGKFIDNNNDGIYDYATVVPDGWVKIDAEHPDGDYIDLLYEDEDHPDQVTGILRYNFNGGILSENSTGVNSSDVGHHIHKVHADPKSDPTEYATAYFEPLNVGDPGAEDDATRAKLFSVNKGKALLHLTLKCALEPEVLPKNDGSGKNYAHGGNVFGGCFMSGFVEGDSWVDYHCWLAPKCANSEEEKYKYFFSKTDNMHIYDDAGDLETNNALSVYGAGYGADTHSDGDVYLYIKSIALNALGDADPAGMFPYMFNAFGGSNMGTVAGNTNVYYAVGKQGTLLGSLYGGGYKGVIEGNTFVEMAEGFAHNVYGGSRQADIHGASHVWAYDGKARGIENANHLIICNLYGGNDIAGTISGTMPAKFTEGKWNAAPHGTNTPRPDLTGKSFNTYVEISADDDSADRGFPLVGTAFAGGNGEAWQAGDGDKPNVGTALLEIDGGSTLRAFGGGNKATVTGNTYIFTNAESNNFANVTFNDYQKNIVTKVFFSGMKSGFRWDENTLTIDPYHVVRLFGGNNLATMDIQPTWNLWKGKIENVYSGGNMGDMTYYNPAGKPATKDGQIGSIAGVEYNTDGSNANYSPRGLSITIDSPDIYINSLFGGCRMSDVNPTPKSDQAAWPSGEEGSDTDGQDFYGATVNITDGYINNVYGGNDVSGTVHHGTNVNISGAVSGNVYGSGNGHYLYKWDDDETWPNWTNLAMNPSGGKVVEDQLTVDDIADGEGVYYHVKALGTEEDDATQKILTINSYRPSVEKAFLNIAGVENYTDPVTHETRKRIAYVKGNVYCGGNASTVLGSEDTNSFTKFKIGSYVTLNGVFMGSDGMAFSQNDYLADFENLNENIFKNGVKLKSETSYAPGTDDKKYYPNLLSVYMKAVEMKSQPKEFNLNLPLKEAYIGTYCGGGNRGSMLVDKTVNLDFHHDIVIYDKIVGACLDANVVYDGVTAYGGYTRALKSDDEYTKLHMNVASQFAPLVMDVPENKNTTNLHGENFETARSHGFLYPNIVEQDVYYTYKEYNRINGTKYNSKEEYEAAVTVENRKTGETVPIYGTGCNIYGGCYSSGEVEGDIELNIYSNMLRYANEDKLTASGDNVPCFNVYGAGYGLNSHVWGNVSIKMDRKKAGTDDEHPDALMGTAKITLNDKIKELLGNESAWNLYHGEIDGLDRKDYPSANNLFGGGRNGQLIGNAKIDVKNGLVYSDVVAGCYVALMYGSGQVIVGYPKYYETKNSGVYKLNRPDKWNTNKFLDAAGTKPVIVKEVNYLKGELVPENVWKEIDASQQDSFTPKDDATLCTAWNDVDIRIGGGIYGGGYSRQNSMTHMAGSYTTLKLTDDLLEGTGYHYNFDGRKYYEPELSSAGYGGNVSIMVGDRIANGSGTGNDVDKDHIHISTLQVEEALFNDADYVDTADDPNIDKTEDYASVIGKFIKEGGKYTHQGDHRPIRGTKYYNLTGNGGIYGDGHLVFCEGFRAADVTGYGYAGGTVKHPVLMNTFQRLDMLNVNDCCLMLQGSQDFATDLIDATIYSMTRVGELNMTSTIDSDNAYTSLSNEDGTDAAGFDQKRVRNYLGFFNNIHFLGSIISDEPFLPEGGASFHGQDGAKEGMSYYDKKQDYITTYAGSDKQTEALDRFKQRNVGTARNAVGINNGYCLRIQNQYLKKSTISDDLNAMDIYYGPVIGVVEVKLLTLVEGEGGGYVYADNVHAGKETDDHDTGTDHKANGHDFLNVSGNFVFPGIVKTDNIGNQYIVDDCYPLHYGTNENKVDGKNGNGTDSEAHYWYVEGNKYFFNTTLTGYTFNKEHDPFEIITNDKNVLLAGLDDSHINYNLRVKKVVWNSAHTQDYECDLEDRGQTFDNKINNSLDYPYKFTIEVGNADAWKDSEDNAFVMDRKTNQTAKESTPYAPDLEHNPLMMPIFNVRLFDNVDNAPSNDVEGYYKEHLSEPEIVKIVLEARTQGKDVSEEPDYIYTVTMRVVYLQGPSFKGGPSIKNCALPGEKIRVTSESVEVVTTDQLPVTEYGWRLLHPDPSNPGHWITTESLEHPDASPEVLSDSYFDFLPDGNVDGYLPAYYYQNGWNVAYAFKAGGTWFYVPPMQTDDTMKDYEKMLLIHNYHRMKEAFKRELNVEHKGADGARIYIEDEEDLKEFIKILNGTPAVGTVGDDGYEPAVEPYDFKDRNVYLMKDMDLSNASVFTNFKGTFDGFGHTLTIKDDENNIKADGTYKEDATLLENYNASIKRLFPEIDAADDHAMVVNLLVLDGSPDESSREYKNGSFAYNLNKFYLDKRHEVLTESLQDDDPKKHVRGDADKYVEQYYENGDYQYAGVAADQLSDTYYLRTKRDPNYDSNISNHNSEHTHDSRRWNETEEKNYPLYEVDYGKKSNYDPNTPGDFNDYIYFGQQIVKGTSGSYSYDDARPYAIKHNEPLATYNLNDLDVKYIGLGNMSNRVFRAEGFYHTKEDEGFYHNVDAAVIDSYTTAVAFGDESMSIDQPEAGITGFNVDSNKDYPGAGGGYDNSTTGHVTQNLLVYTMKSDAHDKDALPYFAPGIYPDKTEENTIRYHTIGYDKNIDYLHLVDKQDFNAPYAFDVTKRAWYERTPSVFRNVSGTGESYTEPSAWEGICLPFTAKTVTASENKEISHFYGEEPAEGENMQTLHHEYWLTGMVAAAGDKATFARPSVAGTDLFTDESLARQENEAYYYPANTYFTNLTNYTDYHDAVDMPNNDLWARTDAEWYLDNHEFADYVYLSKTVPYLISFPGNDFYEFSMEGTNYNRDTHTKSGNPQLVTFEHSGPVSIAVSDDETGNHATTIGSYNHIGTYLHVTDKLGVNDAGNAFVSEKAILPFRTYMTAATAPANLHRVIRISDGSKGGSIVEPGKPEKDMPNNYLKVWTEGHDIVIEASSMTSLKLYTISGIMLDVLNCKPGINRFPQSRSGIYVVGKKKLIVK